jgi:hypothetical protein
MYICKNRRKSLIVTLGNSNSSDRRYQESEPNLRSWGGESLAHRNSNRQYKISKQRSKAIYKSNTSERLRVPVTYSCWLNRSCQWLVQQANIKIVTLRSHSSNFVQIWYLAIDTWLRSVVFLGQGEGKDPYYYSFLWLHLTTEHGLKVGKWQVRPWTFLK